MRVLIVEDHASFRRLVVQGLREAGYSVDAAGNAHRAWLYLKANAYGVLLLDVGLPGEDGFKFLRRLREAELPTHILMMTARDAIDDRIRGLDLGADDYLVKPFALEELLARVRALARRSMGVKSPLVRVADLEVDIIQKSVRRGSRLLHVSATEYKILEFLAVRRDRIVSRREILNDLYEADDEPNSNLVDVYVRSLRKKLERDGQSRLIHTRRGAGYILKSD